MYMEVHVVKWLLFTWMTEVLTLKGFQGTNEGLCTTLVNVTRHGIKKENQRISYQRTFLCGKWYNRQICSQKDYRWQSIPVDYTYAEQESKLICCSGYKQGYEHFPVIRAGYDKTFTDDLTVCKPVCYQDCKNSVCTAPDTCTCLDGFVKQENSSYNCEPHCSKICQNGYCIAPEECSCYSGYKKDETEMNICHPICSNNCTNGVCTHPETCTCWTDYRPSSIDRFVCEPICSKECINGKCVLPEKCVCENYFVINEYDPYTCDPFCENQCINSNCTSPNTCECFPNYKLDEIRSYVCNPVCSQECLNGTCVSPDECQCLDGFVEFDSPNHCVPSCSVCQYGVCDAPETCLCWEGYGNPPDTNSTCEPVCDEDCVNGFCSAPNQCSCDEGYVNSTGDWTTCTAFCAQPCVNGNCTAPDLCECFPGYDVHESDANLCNPVCSEDCVNSVCTQPETCSCFWGFVSSGNSTSNCSKSEHNHTDCHFLLTLDRNSFYKENKTSYHVLKHHKECIFLDLFIFNHLNFSNLKNKFDINLNCSHKYSNSVGRPDLNFDCSLDSVTLSHDLVFESSTDETSTHEDAFSENLSYEVTSGREWEQYSSTEVSDTSTSEFLEQESFTESSTTMESRPTTIEVADITESVTSKSYDYDYGYEYDDLYPPFGGRLFKRNVYDEWMTMEESRYYTDDLSTAFDYNSKTSTSEELLSEETSDKINNDVVDSSTVSSSVSPNTFLDTQTNKKSKRFSKHLYDPERVQFSEDKLISLQMSISSVTFIKKERITTRHFENFGKNSGTWCYCIKSFNWPAVFEDTFLLQLTTCACQTELNGDPLKWNSTLNVCLILLCMATLLGVLACVIKNFNKIRNYYVGELENDCKERTVEFQNEDIFSEDTIDWKNTTKLKTAKTNDIFESPIS